MIAHSYIRRGTRRAEASTRFDRPEIENSPTANSTAPSAETAGFPAVGA